MSLCSKETILRCLKKGGTHIYFWDFFCSLGPYWAPFPAY